MELRIGHVRARNSQKMKATRYQGNGALCENGLLCGLFSFNGLLANGREEEKEVPLIREKTGSLHLFSLARSLSEMA